MAIKAFANRILIEGEKKKDDGGIIVPKNAPGNEKYLKGKVVSVGERVGNAGVISEMPVKEGDTVFYSAFGWVEIETTDGTFKVLQEEDIFAVEI